MKRPYLVIASVFSLAACGRPAPSAGQAAGPAPAPAPAGQTAGQPPNAGSGSPTSVQASAPPAPSPEMASYLQRLQASAAPSAGQSTAMAEERHRTEGLLIQAKQAADRAKAQAMEDWKARQAKAQAQYKAKVADYAAKLAAQQAEAKATWETRAAEWQAVVADSKASASQKDYAKAMLKAGFKAPAVAQDGMPLPPIAEPPPSDSVVVDAKADEVCEALIAQYRAAVESRDPAKKLAAMQAINSLPPRVSPALLKLYLHIVQGPGAATPPIQ